jgi:hypothetical protein
MRRYSQEINIQEDYRWFNYRQSNLKLYRVLS